MSLFQAKLGEYKAPHSRKRYTREWLSGLTTLQLRDICYREKLVKGIANSLDRDHFIETILRFRGVNEDYLIKEHKQDGFARLQQLLSKSLGKELMPAYPIRNPARLTIYKGLPIEPRDQYKVFSRDKKIQPSNAILLDSEKNICGIFYLLPDEAEAGAFTLCMGKGLHQKISKHKNYHLLYFPEQESERLYEAYAGIQQHSLMQLDYYLTPITNVSIEELAETRTILAIDFGTSNTTAGAYIADHYIPVPPEHAVLNGLIQMNETNVIQFYNPNGENGKWEEIVPTMIGIKNCEKSSEITYEYGYEVMQQENYASGSNRNSVFYEIKRWIHSYKEKEEVVDYQGNLASVYRGDIIRAYLQFIIDRAEHQLKCKFRHIHISSPVKLKKQHVEMFQQLMPEYKIELEDALDEGIAVLYNTIAALMSEQRFQEGMDYQALIIDCGGGTTDLSSCTFTIHDTKLSYQVNIQTTFENGDTNFGGNNLTYRIMQYIKVLFVDYYQHGRRTLKLEDILNVLVGDIYRYIDEHDLSSLYAELERRYEEAEAILPTKYQACRHQSFDEYQQVQGNYHTLWRLAEQIKTLFYGQAGLVRVGMVQGQAQEADCYLLRNKSFRLSIKENQVLDFVYDIPPVIINIEEINGLLKGDIYHMIKKFLEEFYIDGTLQDFSVIKMTGQSCRIDLFRDAIKEFVAGRSIEFRQKDNYLKDLKLSCLLGAIRYLQDKKSGIMKADIVNTAPISPYRVYAFTHHQTEKTLLECNEKVTQTQGNISKPRESDEIIFYICDAQDNLRAKYCYLNQKDEFKLTNYEEINSIYKEHISQEAVDTIAEKEIKYFVYGDESDWGFSVLPIMREEGQLYVRERQFYPFENEQWEVNYFDGTH